MYDFSSRAAGGSKPSWNHKDWNSVAYEERHPKNRESAVSIDFIVLIISFPQNRKGYDSYNQVMGLFCMYVCYMWWYFSTEDVIITQTLRLVEHF